MGLDFGLEQGLWGKRNFRWLFYIPEVCGDKLAKGLSALPPSKAARPNLAFKEMEAKHLHEDVFYPAKPDWKPINLTLYDLNFPHHPIWRWIKQIYNVNEQSANFYPPCQVADNKGLTFLRIAEVRMYDGCGTVIEQWVFEDAWPQNINFMTLDMADNQVTVCDLTLRYARAYVLETESKDLITTGDFNLPNRTLV